MLDGQGGSAFLTNTISLSSQASFSTHFTFRISNPLGASDLDGQGADGIVFVVQTVASNVGGLGGGIGYIGITPSVGVEFDTWYNSGIGGADDGNHLGIDLNGDIVSAAYIHIPTRMNDGDIWDAWVDYDGVTNLLERASGAVVAPSRATRVGATMRERRAETPFPGGTWQRDDRRMIQ